MYTDILYSCRFRIYSSDETRTALQEIDIKHLTSSKSDRRVELRGKNIA
jgi:hypothetical protein